MSIKNKKLNSRLFISPLLTDKGNLISSDKKKTDLLNTFFHSVFTQDNGHALKLNCKVTRQQFMKDVIVTEANVTKSIQKLNNSLSRTQKNIPSYFLKKIAFPILHVLTYLYNLCLSKGSMPYQWKLAIITPVHKKGSHDTASNYRPISLTSVFCRVIENIVSEKLLQHFFTYNLLSPKQYGFVPFRSTCSQLLNVLNKWFKSFDEGYVTNVIIH